MTIATKVRHIIRGNKMLVEINDDNNVVITITNNETGNTISVIDTSYAKCLNAVYAKLAKGSIRFNF